MIRKSDLPEHDPLTSPSAHFRIFVGTLGHGFRQRVVQLPYRRRAFQCFVDFEFRLVKRFVGAGQLFFAAVFRAQLVNQRAQFDRECCCAFCNAG